MKKYDLTFMEKFNPEKNTVKEFKHWIVTIREKQVTLGACIFTLKRNVQSLSDITDKEAAEFIDVISWYENTIKSLFGAEKFNYVVAMMKDNFVHYHAFPRYSKSINQFDADWSDNDWPKIVTFRNVEVSREKIDAIINAIKNN